MINFSISFQEGNFQKGKSSHRKYLCFIFSKVLHVTSICFSIKLKEVKNTTFILLKVIIGANFKIVFLKAYTIMSH